MEARTFERLRAFSTAGFFFSYAMRQDRIWDSLQDACGMLVPNAFLLTQLAHPDWETQHQQSLQIQRTSAVLISWSFRSIVTVS